MDKYYTVRQAAELTGVRANVLRYWEEEMGLKIQRNELGHRCYTGNDIQLFVNIKELKTQGMQLRGIKEKLLGKRQETGTVPGIVPGTVPGIVPGVVPGTVPGTAPGIVPETVPGIVPEIVPETETRSGDVSEPAETAGTLPEPCKGKIRRITDALPQEHQQKKQQKRQQKIKQEKQQEKEQEKQERKGLQNRLPERGASPERMLEFQQIMERLIAQELQMKNEEEFRCRSLDSAIRSQQLARREAAAASERGSKKSRKKRIRQKQ